jgi:hypothetical protein
MPDTRRINMRKEASRQVQILAWLGLPADTRMVNEFG